MSSLFSDQDLRLIEALQYDASLTPSFDAMKACLVWSDERPEGLSPAGYETLCDLWIVRGYIHRAVPRDEWGVDPVSGYFQEFWDSVEAERPDWPGFRRMVLNDEDKRYLDTCLRDSGSGL